VQPSQVIVAYAYNPSYLVDWDWNNHSLKPIWAKKVEEILSQWEIKLNMVVHYGRKLKIGLQVKANVGKKWDLTSKITKGKRAGGVDQAVEHLPSSKSWDQIPVPTPPKKTDRFIKSIYKFFTTEK
jgi:hypothetical protein